MINHHGWVAGEERSKTRLVSWPEVAGIGAGERLTFQPKRETSGSAFPAIATARRWHRQDGDGGLSRLVPGSPPVGGRKVSFRSGRVGPRRGRVSTWENFPEFSGFLARIPRLYIGKIPNFKRP